MQAAFRRRDTMPRKESAVQGNRRRQGVEVSRKNTHRARKKPPQTPPTKSNDSSGERALSAAALAQLDRENARNNRKAQGRKRPIKREAEARPPRPPSPPSRPRPRPPPPPKAAKHRHDAHQRVGKKHKTRRVASGAAMEEGRAKRLGGDSSEDSFDKLDSHRRRRKRKSRKKLWILLGCSVVIVIIIIVVAVVVSKNKGGGGDSSLEGKDRDSIPAQRRNTYLDPWSWQTTTDFNVTFTEDTVGGLPVMGLFTEWDDSARANDQVPPLKEAWGSYGKRPARGVNLGGWLTLEPFITPSLFRRDGIIDEWSLCRQLGPSAAAKTLEEHYATFVTEDTFKAMAAAGLDHVRIPFSYWAVEVYQGDPYVFRTSWRYLLRGIEWARRHGLRVNLDLHGLPGSQNGWNHSGRSGVIGWLNGTDGALNGRRSLEIHDRLSRFFAQARYRNVISHYGLVNEPKMTFLAVNDVVTWTRSAYETVRRNGIDALVVFGDGFMGLEKWKGLMPSEMVLDVHQYLIFNENQIDFSHRRKVQYACAGWSQQADLSMDPNRGHGPTVFAEWSQADTDCARFLTGVGWGNRWEGTYDSGDKSTSVLTPRCPARDASCSCAAANEADASRMAPPYRRFLQHFAEAQMHSFERGWGWWYWTWKTESAPLWSYEAGLGAGILPRLAYRRDFNCDSDVPDFAHDGLPETY
ncbi:hypothetical protein L249_2717 [Ophiocordyceps polyrhachis-furcata BCC 54312]|uniref:glucan 1,3-beta-glucosidase n=1 Tax=Ophiocordyceps polyrhachis-furcata BCC 54312 TaxID=1330021 RepID=A0A367LNR3_9HYPO|nr:hypothetical protein L249_2717 [Ophiocordyceps polyrhachis-furcata BCC 54312]